MPDYAIIKDDRCIATGTLKVLPDRDDVIERIDGVPAVGDVFKDGQWVTELPEPAPHRPQVGPVEFKLLFTSAERLKLKELRAGDPVMEDFFEIIEDPRLQYIDLSLNSTANGVDHCLAILAEAGVVNQADIDTRREEILSGVAQ